jgi:DNA-binding transcriptional LysR family regulator
MEPSDGLAALCSWQADVAIIDDLSLLLGAKRHAVDRVPLAEDVLVALLPSRHALAGRPSLQVSDLRDEPWAIDSTASVYGDFVLNLCRRAGFEPQLRGKCKSFEMVAALVKAGCAVSVVPGLRTINDMRGVAVVKFKPEVRRKISLAYRKGERSHPAVRVFVEQLLSSAAEIVPS